MTSQIVRNDLTNVLQYQLTQRIISFRKVNEIHTIASGRGKKLKCNEFTEVGIALEYVFGEMDTQRGGGLEAHPHLRTGTLYQRVDNKMKRVCEILLSMAPEGLKISLSACYNYFRQGSAQARRHHSSG